MLNHTIVINICKYSPFSNNTTRELVIYCDTIYR